jgi:hypothetical protein
MTKPTSTLDAPRAVCARCGATFRCGSLAGDAACWCASLPALPPDRLCVGEACLCRACLLVEIERARNPG